MERQTKPNDRIPMSDEGIVALYFERSEQAIGETDFKYGKYLFSIAYHILHHSLDCEECVNDTYLGAWNAMPPTRPNVLKAFLTTIARRIAIKRYHSNTRKSVIPSELTVSLSELEDILADDGDTGGGETLEAQRLGRVLSDFVSALPRRKRYIFMSRYYAAEPIDTIAGELGVSRSTVNKELAAIRSALKERLESEGYLI